jgi:CHAT domain-containing protein/tetratricopeptide (TPR) repeat protein
MAAVLAADAHLAEERSVVRDWSGRRARSDPRWWLGAVAAAVLIAVIAFPLLKRRNDPIARLIALAPASSRIVEPRLSGGFAWAPYRGPMRSTDSAADAERLKLGGAAGDAIARAQRDRGAEAQHAAGVAMLLVEKPEMAAARLEPSARASHDAKTWSDLAAARYAAAVQLGQPSLLPRALAAADEALRIDERLPEALFNRALILERMGLALEARRAWKRYLEADPTSPWAAEARTRLAALPTATGSSRFERDQPLLERAAVAGDWRGVRTLVDSHRERFRAFAEAEYLGRWGEAAQRNDDAGASRWLTTSRAVGDALVQLSGESLLRDAVRAIDDANPRSQTTLAEAHVTYRRGRIAYSRHEREPAERDLRSAAALFATAGDPMALMARHYAAGARLARNDFRGARAELVQLRAEAGAHSTYFALGAHVRWELARSLASDEDWEGQVRVLTEAAELFRRGGERAGEAMAESLLGGSLRSVGRADEAWSAFIRSFHALSNEAQSNLLETDVSGAAYLELRAGQPEAALALTRVAESLQQGGGAEPILAIETLLQRAMLETITGGDAVPALRRAEEIASRLTDADIRARQLADVDGVRGADLLARDPRAAEAALTRAIDFHRSRGRFANLPEPLLLRARCAVRLGRRALAERDLEDGVQAVERHPVGADGAGVGLGTAMLDAGHQLFAEAIRLRLDRGDDSGAFAYAERARGGEALTIDELRRRLAGSSTAVIEIVSLADEVVVFAVSRNDALVARRPRAAAELASLAERSLAGDERASAALYDDLVRPVERVMMQAGNLVIVPDPLLAGVPFASLFDSARRQFLVEKLPVAIASSASSLRPAARGVMTSIAGIALPAPDGAMALPETEKELADVASLYPRGTTIPADRATWAAFERAAGSADIIHVAGHTERLPGDGGQALLFAGSGSGPAERVSWKTIVAAPVLHARVVVLAACETLRPARSLDTRSLSLGDAFAAGGADVVGTLVPIPDRDAHALFLALHRELSRGAGAAEALRAVQLEMIHNEAAGGGARAWRALAVLTRHVS